MGANCSQYCMTDEKKVEFDVQGYNTDGANLQPMGILDTPYDKSTSTQDINIDELNIKSFDDLNWQWFFIKDQFEIPFADDDCILIEMHYQQCR